ncbi:MAG TPA: hypothetical protein VLN58_02355 [Verrucomicrobiae bacterium]|nr:hypothetical protein [Verrucomicrobiae bacterium]
MTDNKTPWLPPSKPEAYASYEKRRNEILKCLARDMGVREIAKELGRGVNSVYVDLAKAKYETDTNTDAGLYAEAIRRGWLHCPAERPHIHREVANTA